MSGRGRERSSIVVTFRQMGPVNAGAAILRGMSAASLVPMYGHSELRTRLREMVARAGLPATLLFQGQQGVGKQRLALWLGQYLLCESPGDNPCGDCRQCQFSHNLRHPDLHWIFPRPRPKDTDPDLADVRTEYQEAVAERLENGGLYEPPSGSDGIFVATIRMVVQQAVLSPSMAKRKVFVIGDAERMVPQEGSEQAANAFLKLLEEPLADTTIVMTTSEPGALLPTVRSRSVAFRLAPIGQEEMRSFLGDERVQEELARAESVPSSIPERLVYAAGAPGRLFSGATWGAASESARRIMASVDGRPADRYEAAWTQAASRARGSFADTLDALTAALHARARNATKSGAEREALAAARAVEIVEAAKEQVAHNVSPQLLTVNLIRDLQDVFS